ncbi:MAG TPA: methyltransferase domain-containing protein [Pyrinomonadaceae bacterium]|nr:methyltransferase domain-containing protein [Pyrinomonadaceae bacterium]
MKDQLKNMATKSKTALVAYKIYHNWQFKRRFASGDTESLHGSTHSHIPLADSISYINTQFDDYLRYGELSPADLSGKRIFELGFGDNVGVALRFLAAGAGQVVCLDKFYSKRDKEHEREIYLALRETLGGDERRRFDEAVDLSEGIKTDPLKIRCIYGVDVEEAGELKTAEPFDFALSRGAIQDIFEPEAALRAMDRILKPGGLMLHKIDLSDQGMFRLYGMNPLTFLTIPDSVYRLMAEGSGKPNRKKMSYYRRLLEEMGYDVKMLITDIIGRGGRGDLSPHKEKIALGVDYSDETLALVRDIRPKLSPGYRKMSDEELLVDGIFVVARKPAA